jgi:3-methylcrotonyl-CoA carboxylase alpha subunit
MDAETREAVCGAAVRAAKAVNYESAGTIEFIADASDGLRADRIWFMEMNTRLQVEHPVTEEITGQDLVEWQLRVASGEELPKTQDELTINGHAIEARLYAEDPAKGFLPSIGLLERFRLPRQLPDHVFIAPSTGSRERFSYDGQLRLETGFEEGDQVSQYYDPMLAKLIFHGEDRLRAAIGLTELVGSVECWPIRTNASMLHALLVQPDFHRAKLTTGFIDDHAEDVIYDEDPGGAQLSQVARLFVSPDIPAELVGFRLNCSAQSIVRVSDGRRFYEADLNLELHEQHDRFFRAEQNGSFVFASATGETRRFSQAEPRGTGTSHGLHDGEIEAPMPGKVTAVEVKQGEKVAKGQRLLTLEAMKMEHALTAPFDGTVAELNAKPGSQVTEGQLLVKVEADA